MITAVHGYSESYLDRIQNKSIIYVSIVMDNYQLRT